MNQNCWQIWPDRGFLINPDPLVRLAESSALSALLPQDTLERIHQGSTDLPELLRRRTIRSILDALPVYDMSSLNQISDFYVVERLMQIYGYFASAFVYATNEGP